MDEATAARVDLVIDFSAYADRIGVDSDATLAEVHRAHVFAIPFENLDPHRGVPVSLEAEDVERKLVAEQRGGYCFEQNLLLASALRELGHEVEPMLAWVRAGAPPGTLRPRSHLVLRVEDGTEAWLADVGFGLGTPIEPIPFAVGVEVEQLGWRFRLVEDDREIVLQSCDGGAWADVYGFVPEPVPQVDIETSNWFTSTSPRTCADGPDADLDGGDAGGARRGSGAARRAVRAPGIRAPRRRARRAVGLTDGRPRLITDESLRLGLDTHSRAREPEMCRVRGHDRRVRAGRRPHRFPCPPDLAGGRSVGGGHRRGGVPQRLCADAPRQPPGAVLRVFISSMRRARRVRGGCERNALI
jgi:N-hydroxyarylamine O-acetyltransferase